MKKIILLLLLPLLLQACQEPDKLAQLETLKAQKVALELEISALEESLGDSLPGRIEKIKYVEVRKIKPSSFQHFIEVQGTVDTDQNVIITSQSPGTIEKVHVRAGDKVKKGQLLFSLDAQVLKNSLAEIQTSLNFATEMYEKQKALWEQKIGSEVQYLTAKNQKQSLEGRLATTREQLALTRVVSPIDGVVDNLIAKSGEMTSPGMPMGRIVNLSEFEVKANVAENYSSRISNGTKALLWFPDLNKEMETTIAYTGNIIDPVNRTFGVVIRFTKTAINIKPNMVCVVKIVDYASDSDLVIPVNTIQRTDRGEYVFVAKESNGKYIAERKKIESEMEYNGRVVVKSGLEEGENLIVFGFQDLTNGQTVAF